MTAGEIFDYYRTTRALTEDDKLDFVSFVCDTPNLTEGAMAVAGLTLSLIENGPDEERLQMLVNTIHADTQDIILERAIVGLLLLMIEHDAVLRNNMQCLDLCQEALTNDLEITFTALCNIARTTQVGRVVRCNQNLTKDILPLLQNNQQTEIQPIIQRYRDEMVAIAQLHLDQNFVFFKDLYKMPYFRGSAANWLLPWSEDALLNIPEDDREDVHELLSKWPICDSDKFALINNKMYKMLKNVIQDRLQMDSLGEMGIAMGGEDIITNQYTQQLYRFFQLSPFTQVNPFEKAFRLRETMVYRLVVVGKAAQDTIGELLWNGN